MEVAAWGHWKEREAWFSAGLEGVEKGSGVRPPYMHMRACVRDTTPIYTSMSFHPSNFIPSIVSNHMQSLRNI